MPLEPYRTVSAGAGKTVEHPRSIGARRKRDEVLILWQRDKAVPLAIASKVGLSVTAVSRVLAEEGVELASYLTTTGGRERQCCPHCGKDI